MSRISKPEVIIVVPSYPSHFYHAYGDTDAPTIERALTVKPSQSDPDKLCVSRTDLISRCLQRSIHKGAVLGLKFCNDTTLYQPDALPQRCISEKMELVLDHQHDTTEALISSLNERRNHLNEEALEFAKVDLTLDLAFSSDHIEGSTIRWKDTRRLIIESQDRDSATEEEREFINHVSTIKHLMFPMASQSINAINEEFMHSLHRSLAVTDCVRYNQLGVYRTDVRTVSHRDLAEDEEYFAPPADVPNRTRQMFEDLYVLAATDVEPIYLATWLHQKFIQIHPYTDGNGRTGRLLMNAVLLIYGFPLTSIQSEIRRIYYDALHSAFLLAKQGFDAKSATPPLALLLRIVAESVLRSVDIVEGVQQIEHSP